MTSDDYGFQPARDEFGYIVADYGFPEHNPVEDIAYSSVGALPHLLQLEFLHSIFIRGYSGTLHCYIVFECGLSTVDGDLIVGAVSILDAQILVVQLDI